MALGATAVLSTKHAVEQAASRPVFAKAKALESLQLPTHGVMHTRRSSDASSPVGMPLTQSVDEWFDLDGHAYRLETRGIAGVFVELTVMNQGRMTSVGVFDPYVDTVVTSSGPPPIESQKFVLTTVDHQRALSAKDNLYYSTATDVRDSLSSGEATVSGPISYNGVQCWVVDYGAPTSQFRAYMRTGDYSLVCWGQRLRGPDGRLQYVMGEDFPVHETVDRSTLPADFFSLDAPEHAVPEKQIVERRHVRSVPN